MHSESTWQKVNSKYKPSERSNKIPKQKEKFKVDCNIISMLC